MLRKLLDQFPRAVLWEDPTPLQPAPRLAEKINAASVWIKRDDCNGLAFGGNKVRQLEYYVGEARDQGADTLLITGAVQSNFVRTAAAASAKLGWECHVQLEDRVPNASAAYTRSGNVLLDQMLGAHIHHFPEGENEEGADARLVELAQQLSRRGKTPYIVHLHPSHPPLGALGYLECAMELVDQFKAFPPDRIFVPSGSGNTHAGLLFGLRMLDSRIPVTGSCVRRSAEQQSPRLTNRFDQIAQLLDQPNPVGAEDLLIDDAFLHPGYGLAGPETREAMRLAARTESLILDPVYTAKTMAALISHSRSNPGENLLFVHTGGGPSVFGYLDELAETFSQ